MMIVPDSGRAQQLDNLHLQFTRSADRVSAKALTFWDALEGAKPENRVTKVRTGRLSACHVMHIARNYITFRVSAAATRGITHLQCGYHEGMHEWMGRGTV